MASKAIGQVLIELTATTAKLQEEFGKAKEHLKGFQAEVEHIAHLIEGAFAFKVGEKLLDGLKELTESVIDLAKEGEKAQQLEKAFVSLGGSVGALDRARDATMGVVDATDLMQLANKGLLAGIPKFAENFDKIAALGARVGQALGTDAKGGIEAVTAAIVKGRAPALERVGIFIDTAKAAKNYAEAHGIAAAKSGDFEKALNKQQKALANSLEAMTQLEAALKRFPPVIDTVTKAQEAAKNEWHELMEQIGIQMNSNSDLITSFRELGETIKHIDFGQLGTNLAQLTSFFVDLANVGIKFAVGALNQFIDDFKRLQLLNEEYSKYSAAHPIISSIPIIGQAAAIGSASASADRRFDIQKEAQKIDSATVAANEFAKTVGESFQKLGQGIKPTTAEVEKLMKDAEGVGASMKKAGGVDNVGLREGLTLAASQLATLKQNAVAARTYGEDLTGGIGKAKDEAGKLNAELAKLHADNVAEEIKQKFEESLKLGNYDAAKDYLTQYTGAIGEAADEAAKKYKGADAEAIEQFKNDFTTKALGPMSDKLRDEMTKAFKTALQTLMSGVNEFGSSLGEITAGLKQAFGIDLPNGMQKVLDIAKGLQSIFDGIVHAVESISKITDSLEKITNASSASGGGGGGILSTVAGYLGFGGGSAASPSGAPYYGPGGGPAGQGAELAPAAAGSGGPVGIGIAATLAAAFATYQQGSKGNAIGAGAIGGLAFGLTGGLAGFGLGMANGAFGGNNADMDARRSFQDWYSKQTGKEIDVGSHNAFDPGQQGFDLLHKQSSGNQSMLTGVGEALKSILGITKDIGPQIGAILLNDVGGNVDEVRAKIKGLGISAEDMKAAIIKAGIAAGKTFLQIQTELQGVDKAFEPGIEGAGNLAGAIKEIKDSGDTSITALQGLVDLAVEAGQAGAKTLTQMKQKLTGLLDPKDLEIIFKAFAAYGIKSVEDLKNSTQETQIAIAAMMEALGFSFKQISDAIDGTTDSVKNLDNAASNVTVPTASTTGTTAAADRRAVMDGRRLGLTNRADAIDSLNRAGGRLAVQSRVGGNGGNGAMVVHIDARNAAPGTEAGFRQAMEDLADDAVRRAVEAVSESTRRSSMRSF